MKKISRTLFSFIFVLSLASIAFSDLTTSITSLAARNAEGYLSPFGTMMGTSMNSGFYRKASPHKILGFDITLDIAYGLAPPGQTTYDFVIPDDSIGYSFPFEFPKSYLMDFIPIDIQSNVLGNIPNANTQDQPEYDGELFQDFEIGFNLPLNMLLAVDDTNPAQNILGDSTTIPLEFDFGVAGTELFSQIVDGTWAVAKNIDGIGKNYVVYDVNDLDFDGNTNEIIYEIEARFDSTSFRNDFAANEDIMSTLESTLGEMNIAIPIPGGFGHFFPENLTGVPLPIVQASVGLPFHTELTARGLPVAVSIPNFGSVKYGGFGGKIGISDYLSDILYKSENEIRRSKSKDLQHIIDSQPSDIKTKDVSKAMSYLLLQEMDIHEIDSLNYLFGQGDPAVVIEIQNRMRDAQIKLESKPESKKKRKKKKKFPIDLSVGYYTNDLILDLDGQVPLKINSINRMLALQVGKTFNMPFIPWLGGIGIYGGLGWESSNMTLDYTFVNPLSFSEEIKDDVDIHLDFKGDNNFRKLIGARMRILFVDAYVDYNMGTTSNAINLGAGITFR